MISFSVDIGVIDLLTDLGKIIYKIDSGAIEFGDNENFISTPGLLNLDGTQLFNLDGTPLFNLT
jgi:hypothetical protein